MFPIVLFRRHRSFVRFLQFGSGLLAAALIAFATPAMGQGQGVGQNEDLPPGLFSHASLTAQQHARPVNPSAIRARQVEIDLNLLAQDELLLNLFEDATFVARLDRRRTRDTGTNIWIGHVPGIPHSRVILAERDGVVSGTVRWPEKLYEINPTSSGRHSVEEIDGAALPPHIDPKPAPGAIPGDHDPVDGQSHNHDHGSPENHFAGEIPGQEGGTGSGQNTAAASIAIDLMMVYTERSRARYNPNDGDSTGIETRIEAAVADANQANINSQVDLQFNIVHMDLVAYDENTGGMDTSLYDLTDTIDGQMDSVHGLRDTYGADLVGLITEDNDYCGIAWVMQSVSTGFASNGFSVVYSSCLSSQTLAHELGHNQGNMHDRANSSFGGAYPYSYGYQNTGNWRTVMAYSNGCGGCFRIDHFSNPEVLYSAEPTGIDHSTDPQNSADNALSLNNTAATVAAFRESAPVSPPAAPSDLAATVLSHSEIALSWTDNADNESSYRVERSPNGSTWSLLVSLGANATDYIDTGLSAKTSYHYRVRAGNSAGVSSWSNPANATTPELPPFVDDVAQADLPIAGNIGGSYISTQANGSSVQSIGERSSGGKKQNRYSYLEHEWEFQVTGGTSVTFYCNAYATASSDDDSFVFSYSTSGSNFIEMFTVAVMEDIDSYYTYVLPPSVSGTIYVKVMDSDRSAGNTDLDTVSVDHMYIRSDTGGGSSVTPPAQPTGLMATAMSSSRIDLDWTDNALDETGFEIEASPDGSDWTMIAMVGADVTGYSDTMLNPSTEYHYRVRATNSGGPSGYSNSASATTLIGSSVDLSAFGYKEKGRQRVDLSWSGATGLNVDIYRDGALLTTTANDGDHTDSIGKRGGGSYSYVLCEIGGGACSDPVPVVF